MTYGKTVKIMKILPHEIVTFRTALSIGEIVDKLKAITEHRKPSNFISQIEKHPKAYQGLITNEGFTILRNIDYRNSFRPVVNGKLQSAVGYSEIDIDMKLHKFVRIFMSIWLMGVSMAAIATIIDSIRSSSLRFEIFGVPVMFLFGYFLCTIAFKKESNRVKKDFQNLFNATIV